jgi:hypothetical protein
MPGPTSGGLRFDEAQASGLAHSNRSGGYQPRGTPQEIYKQPVFNGLNTDLHLHVK